MIHKVQKRPRKGKLSKTYYLRYRYGTMPRDKWYNLGVTNKEVAEKKAMDFRREWEQEDAGLLLPKKIREGASQPLVELTEDYLDDLLARGKNGRNGKDIKQTRARLGLLFEECGWKYARDVDPDSFSKWRAGPEQQKKAPSTLNHFLSTAKTFFNWLVSMGLIPFNPLANVKKIDIPEGATKEFRALSSVELASILAILPDYRRITYLTAAFTGLRRGELKTLKRKDVVLGIGEPCIKIRGVNAKNKKSATIPLVPQLAEALRGHIPTDAQPEDPVFPRGIPNPETFQKDIEAAGVPYEDARGHRATFHSLRNTWCTMLQSSGAQGRVVQELMRHSDPKLTNQLYTDDSLLPTHEAVRNLGAGGEWTQIWTQISGKSGQNLSGGGEIPPDTKKPTSLGNDSDGRYLSPPGNRGQIGGMDGTRTRDLRRDRPAF